MFAIVPTFDGGTPAGQQLAPVKSDWRRTDRRSRLMTRRQRCGRTGPVAGAVPRRATTRTPRARSHASAGRFRSPRRNPAGGRASGERGARREQVAADAHQLQQHPEDRCRREAPPRERIPVRSHRPARTARFGQRRDPEVLPAVDDAVRRHAPIAQHPQDLECHPFEPAGNDHLPAGGDDPLRRPAPVGLGVQGEWQITDRQARTRPAVIAS